MSFANKDGKVDVSDLLQGNVGRLDTNGKLQTAGCYLLAEFVAPAAGIPHGNVHVVIPAGVRGLQIFWQGTTDYNSPNDFDPVSMYVNGPFDVNNLIYGGLERQAHYDTPSTTFQNNIYDNTSNNLRVGYARSTPSVGQAGGGMIWIPYIGNNPGFGVTHVFALSLINRTSNPQVSPPLGDTYLIGGGVWTSLITDVTLKSNLGTKFLQGSSFAFYAYT